MIKTLMSVVIVMLVSVTANASDGEDNKIMSMGMIKESTVMLYYRELDAPREFYQHILGLQASYEDDWVSIYSLTPTSAVGLVQEGGSAYHRARKDNAVMLSLVVDNTDAWYKRIKSTGRIKILKEIYDHPKAPIRAFLIEDPGGYTVEIFQWLK